jgi:hypothetical protein
MSSVPSPAKNARKDTRVPLDLESAVFLFVALTADQVPSFNIEPVCREIAERADAPSYSQNCLRKERNAREQLKAKWTAFPAADRSYCVQLASLGGEPSYVELITCLETAQAARSARDMQSKDTSGSERSRRRAKSF